MSSSGERSSAYAPAESTTPQGGDATTSGADGVPPASAEQENQVQAEEISQEVCLDRLISVYIHFGV
jgi:hypothetical protein